MKKIFLLLICFSHILCAISQTPKATIERSWIETDVQYKGNPGITIHLAGAIDNMKDKNLEMRTYITCPSDPNWFCEATNIPLDGSPSYFSYSVNMPYDDVVINDLSYIVNLSKIVFKQGLNTYTIHSTLHDHNGRLLVTSERHSFKYTGKSSSTAPVSKKTSGVQTSNFYNTYGVACNGGFWIVGKGLNDVCLTLKITDSQITLSGAKEPYLNEMVFRYKGKNKDGSLCYEGRTDIGMGVYFLNNINLSSDRSCFTLVTFTSEQWTTSILYVSSKEERNKLIEEKMVLYNSGAPMQVANNNISESSDSKSWMDNLRYPEYQRYNDERGNFDENKYKRIQQAKCNVCNGTGINPHPDTSPLGSRVAVYHDGKSKCSICGEYYKHHHDYCASCH